MQYIVDKPFIFKQQPRRARLRAMLLVLGAFTVWNAGIIAAHAQGGAGADPFDRLVAPPALSTARFGEGPARVYATLGGSTPVTFERVGQRATIRFLCAAGNTDCDDTPHPLTAHAAGGGATMFRASGGATVLRVSATGGATLLPGAPFVPTSVPPAGRAVIETNRH